MMRVFVNGHNINVERHGPESGPVVVLLHHGLGSVRAWRGQVPALVEAGYRVVTYDRWGYGESDTRPGLDLPTFTTDLEDLHGLLNLLGIDCTALVGHSDGGTIALYYATQQPERISCVVTVAAHIFVEPKMEPAFLEIRQAFEMDERFRLGMQSAHGDKYEAVFHNWFDGWYRVESRSWDMRILLGQIKCPVLVVQGAEDEHATSLHAEEIAGSIQGAELWLIPAGRHMVPQENADEFNAKIIRFLKDHQR